MRDYIRFLKSCSMFPDNKGRVPLWEAIRGGHDEAVHLLADAGAGLSSGDVALYTRVAVEAGDAALLEDVACHGGDVTVACWDGGVKVAKVLLEHGADADREDVSGRTPRTITDQLGHRDMQALFTRPPKKEGSSTGRRRRVPAAPVTRFRSAPVARFPCRDSTDSSPASSGHDSPRRMTTFRSSLFGVLSSSHANRHDGGGTGRHEERERTTRARVTISCPERGGSARKLVFMPETVRQLVELGGSTFGFTPSRAVTTGGAVVDDARLVRDGDHILLVTYHWVPDTCIMERNQ
jgi:potassium channel